MPDRSHAILNETSTGLISFLNTLSEAKYVIYTSKRDDENPHPFHMGLPPPLPGEQVPEELRSSSPVWARSFRPEVAKQLNAPCWRDNFRRTRSAQFHLDTIFWTRKRIEGFKERFISELFTFLDDKNSIPFDTW